MPLYQHKKNRNVLICKISVFLLYQRSRRWENMKLDNKIKNCLRKTLAQSGKQNNQINAHTTTFYVYFVNILWTVSAKPCLLQVIRSTPCKMSIEPCIRIVLNYMIFSRILNGMLRQNIEHFLKKRKYEKLGFSEMN